MTPGVLRGIPEEQQNLEKQIERQMGGCMAGFLQIFDRHQILAGKRIYSAKRLPSSPAVRSTSPSERSECSASSPPSPAPERRPPSPEPMASAEISARPSLPLPMLEGKEGLKSSWKFREAPRLSLDSRAIVDGKGKLFPREIRTTPVKLNGNQSDSAGSVDDQDTQRRSPSVVARLMGLDALPNSGGGGGEEEPLKKAVLRRSASESRVSRDLLQSRFVDGSSFQLQKPPLYHESPISEERFRDLAVSRIRDSKPEKSPRTIPPSSPPPPPTAFSALQRKSFFNAQDYYFIPEPSKRGGSLYGEIERRLRLRGIDEPAKDLETLKQMLEALQLKGLLHSKRPQHRPGGTDEPRHQINGLNFIYDHSPVRTNYSADPPIVVMKPPARPTPLRRNESPLPPRSGAPPPSRRNHLSTLPGRLTRRDRVEMDRSPARSTARARTPDPGEARSPSSLARRRPVAETTASPKRVNPDRRIPSVPSPKPGSSRRVGTGSDPTARSPRTNRRSMAEISPRERISSRVEEDASSTVSDGSFSNSSQFVFERMKLEEYREGRSLLERCDKLLHSIAEITSGGGGAADDPGKACATELEEEQEANAAEQQPSPVSVLDAAASSFYCDDVASPSPPVTKRCIDFKDRSVECIEERWNQDGSEIGDSDFAYVTEILKASDPHRTADFLSSLEKKHKEAMDNAAAASKALQLHRRLVFDTVAEIVERRSQVSPWEAFTQSRSSVAAGAGRVLPSQVWAELRRMQEHVPADDLCDVICGVLEKDMTASTAAERGWSSRSVEMSDAVLDIERLIFKDLVAETIRNLTDALSPRQQCRGAAAAAAPCRKLLF